MLHFSFPLFLFLTLENGKSNEIYLFVSLKSPVSISICISDVYTVHLLFFFCTLLFCFYLVGFLDVLLMCVYFANVVLNLFFVSNPRSRYHPYVMFCCDGQKEQCLFGKSQNKSIHSILMAYILEASIERCHAPDKPLPNNMAFGMLMRNDWEHNLIVFERRE